MPAFDSRNEKVGFFMIAIPIAVLVFFMVYNAMMSSITIPSVVQEDAQRVPIWIPLITVGILFSSFMSGLIIIHLPDDAKITIVIGNEEKQKKKMKN